MKTRILPYAALMLCAFWSMKAQALDNFIEQSDLGTTDWIEGYVEATGQGTSRYMGNRVQEELMAKQAARTTAQSRLLEIIKGIRITGLSTLGSQAQGNTRAATRIKGTLRGARRIRENVTWHKDKTSRRGEVPMAEVTLRLCMTPACKASVQNLTSAALIQAGNKNDPQSNPLKPSTYSAVIIDLEQALYLPALAPEIINSDREMIYSQESVRAENIEENGIIHYAKSVAAAKKMPLSGLSPLIIKAIRITKNNQIVLSNADAAQIKGLNALRMAHVVVAQD